MKLWRSLTYITVADFLVRSGYQMGKTPLLPIFAATLGASGVFLGFIVSVSTLTGMVLKPLVGLLSDRWGRRVWLLTGTTFFAVTPFFYQFVDTSEQLFAIRLIHGMATAIYGPVTLALVAELATENRAERLGYFSLARNGGYVVGPMAAGWLLLTMPAPAVFTVIGIISSIAYLPILLLPETRPSSLGRATALRHQMVEALRTGIKTPAVWLAGSVEANFYIVLYAIKTFLPLYALSIGINVVTVGLFLSVIAGVHLICNPFGGRIADRFGYSLTISAGMVIFGATTLFLPFVSGGIMLMVPAILMGIAQALVLPSTIALVALQVESTHIATGMGLVGTLRNTGKVLGPVLAGLLINWFEFGLAFHLLGLGLILGTIPLLYTINKHRFIPDN
jgi:MFS family permease